ncbi:MAG: DUF881 domain-containing protein [Actinomycetota bacterium]|nr:DUF881 domain-containing protein [Actinomycetota bacterium]
MPETSPLGRSVFVAVAILLIGATLAVAARQARPGPRLSRKGRLVDLIRAEERRARTLRAQLDVLRADLEALEGQGAARGRDLLQLRHAADGLEPFAGLAAVAGPGLRVTLDDSSMRTSPTGDPNDLVIHQQDIQAVVNALWASGAEAVAIGGERITAASAIRCVGNTLLLHGSVYSPPYRIAAVGDPARLRGGLASDGLVERFQAAVDEFRLVFEVKDADHLELPAYHGVIADQFAAVHRSTAR